MGLRASVSNRLWLGRFEVPIVVEELEVAHEQQLRMPSVVLEDEV